MKKSNFNPSISSHLSQGDQAFGQEAQGQGTEERAKALHDEAKRRVDRAEKEIAAAKKDLEKTRANAHRLNNLNRKAKPLMVDGPLPLI